MTKAENKKVEDFMYGILETYHLDVIVEGDDRLKRAIIECIFEFEHREVSGKYDVCAIQCADWENIAIGDKDTNKVICHFNNQGTFKETKKLAERVANYLNRHECL